MYQHSKRLSEGDDKRMPLPPNFQPTAVAVVVDPDVVSYRPRNTAETTTTEIVNDCVPPVPPRSQKRVSFDKSSTKDDEPFEEIS